jgi:hypothetical protein
MLMSSSVHAQDAAAAEQLYERGLKDMLAGRYKSGCPALEKSYEMDPLPGALFTLASCYERWGKTHSAVKRYDEYVALATKLPAADAQKQTERVKRAITSLDSLRPRVPTLLMKLSEPDAQVTLDGRPVAGLGAAIEVDPGRHVVVVSAGPRKRDYVVELRDGDRRELDLELPSGPTIPSAEPSPAPAPDASTDDGSGLRIAGVVVGGLGLAAVIAGAVTGGLVFAKKSTVEENCEDAVCNAAGLEAADEAETLGMVSNVTLPVGGAALVAGVLMFFLAPDGSSESEAARAPVRIVSLPGTTPALGIEGTW